MKIGELRELLNGYSEQQLRVIIADLYKAIPKSVKEEKEIDSILTNPGDPDKPKARPRKQERVPDIEALGEETSRFVEYAYQQYFLGPNQFVPKKERPKWRFTAKRLYRSILAAAADEAALPTASELLAKLYTMLCYSCEYTLFNAYDTFEAVGVEQTVFFESVLELKSRHESPSEFVKNAIQLIVDHALNRYTLHSDLMEISLHYLRSLDMIELSVAVCDQMLLKSKESHEQQKTGLSGVRDYKKDKRINNLVHMAFLCYGELQDFERGIEYFKKHYVQKDVEVRLYVLLEFLFLFQQEELFMREYEKALKDKIKPRKQLKELYETVRSTGEFPEYFD